MLKITRSAWNRLTKIQSTRPEISALRLTHENGIVKCRRGVCKPGDQVIEESGNPQLLMTPAVASNLREQTLHAPKTGRGRRLRLKSTPGIPKT